MRGARGGGGGVGPERGRQPAGDGGRGTGGRRVGGRCPLAALGRGAGRDRQPRAERAGEGGVARWPPSSSCSPNFPALDGGEGTSLLRLPLGLLSPLSPACPPTPPSRRLSPGRGCGPSPPAEVRSGAANSLPRPCRGCEPAPSPPPPAGSRGAGLTGNTAAPFAAAGWKRKFAQDGGEGGEGCAQLPRLPAHPPACDCACLDRPRPPESS